MYILIYTKQLSPSSYMTVRKTLHIKSWTRFLEGVYTDVSITTFVHYHHSHENKERFLKKKKRVKGLFVFMTMLSFKQVKSSFGKKQPFEQGCSWIIRLLIVWISDNLNMVFKLKMAVHAAPTKKKICEENNLKHC